jgi:peptide/nickel transport system substrate-binding protein
MLSLLAIVTLMIGCSQRKGNQTVNVKNYAMVGIEGDIDNFNPLFAEDVTAGELNDLFYPGLVTSSFNQDKGILEYQPLIARSWEFENEHKDLRFTIRSDARWSDGTKVTAKDVQASYTLYADSSVASVRQTSVEGLRKSKDGMLNIKDAVELVDNETVIFHFEHAYPGQLFDAGLPILPAHIFLDARRGALLRDDSVNHHPLSSGPFRLKNWKPMQQIELVPNETSVLPAPAKLSDLIYRIIPDYHSRLMQLNSGEIDVFPYINVEDADKLLENNPSIQILRLGERFYDAVNWNNIDPVSYAVSKGKKISPHPLFGNANVRRALTLAINRKEIVESYLKSFGREAIGPVSPLFRWAYNDSIRPLPFNPQQARDLLAAAGWRDSNGDGVLDRNGVEFSFVLKIPAGNELRSTIATVIQNQLHAVGIGVRIEQLERAVFWDDLMSKKFDAAIAGFSVPLQMQLDELWGSDLDKARFNLTSFQNKRVQEILSGAKAVQNEIDHAAAWKEFQAILQREQPCTFLYWMNDLVAVNKRIKGTEIGVLGVSYHAGNWTVE